MRLTDLRENLTNTGIYVSEESYNFLKKSALFGGELLIANVGAYAGLVCEMPYTEEKATLGPNMMLMIFKANYSSSHYMYYLTQAQYIQEQLQLKANSTCAQPKLNKNDVRNIICSLPPHSEQQAIADFLDEKCAGIDTAIANKQKVIDKLIDYKKSLIYECVTGKIEV